MVTAGIFWTGLLFCLFLWLPTCHADLRADPAYCIPNVIHFIKVDGGTRDFSFLHFVALYSAQKHFSPDAVILHCDMCPVGQWWEAAKRTGPAPLHLNIGLSGCFFTWTVSGKAVKKFQHRSDFARLCLLDRYGGVYSDLDSIALRKLGPELLCSGEDFVAGLEDDSTRNAAIGVMLARPSSPYVRHFLEQTHKKFTGAWASHSVLLNAKLVGHDPRCLVVGTQNFYPNFENVTHLSGQQAIPAPGTAEHFASSGKITSWDCSYAQHVFNSFEPMDAVKDKLTDPCTAFRSISDALSNSTAVIAPLQRVVVYTVCEAVEDGVLREEVSACLEEARTVCRLPRDFFFPRL